MEHAQQPQADGQLNKVARDEDDVFPTKQLTILAICRFSEPIAFNSILAYTYVMVQDLHGGDATNAEFYAGLLVSAYAVAEALTAMLWGVVSDRYGRKPVVLFGLVGVAISSLIFGLAKQYWVALLARFVGGALNGNVAVMQTMVAEMVKNPDHEPKAYAVQPFVWALGSIIGSAMGGFLAQPARFYPSVFPVDGVFGRFPYLLPNLVAVATIIIAVIQGIFLLEETNPMFISQEDGSHGHGKVANQDVNETSPLLRVTSISRSIVGSIREGGPKPLFLEEGLPTATGQTFDLRRSSFGTIHSVRLPHDHAVLGASHHQHHVHEYEQYEEPEPPKQKWYNFTIIMLTFSLVLISYHQMAFGSVLPIYLLDKRDPAVELGPHLDIYGGLGFTIHDVGTYMAVNGIIALFIQGLIFPVFVENVGVWRSFLVTVLLYPLSYIPMPFLSLLLGTEPAWLLPFGIYVTMFLQNFFGIICVPCALILLKNACPSSLVLGKVNGLAMSACCAARTVSPPLVGIIYSVGGSLAAWYSCAAIAILGCIQIWCIPENEADVGKVEVESAFKLIEEHPDRLHIQGVVVEDDVIAEDSGYEDNDR
ncbi:major facilitator superfamily domain-containing protein [Pseudomassariella vexata]|uniref:Major facilitator superfamily domain-containing protein n=1 Tax=Pseudomassariella vexata TaxID=1141098 RepID=A0A1Y2DUW6_9PEZI|nr:major facilitator superfamily domain-containing protein [Pseudomassariella vexata]ORY62445.1 major facilitator superfamily domain-containing protein [Pseudomassariella vexata]